MPVPANYNGSGELINVDPLALWRYSQTDMLQEAQGIIGSLSRISATWENLRLGWAGSTADEAQDFNDRWNGALVQMFGTEADPNGAVQKIAEAVGGAALNYAGTEDSVKKMFDGFLNTGSPQPPTRDNQDAPITETTPPWPTA